jgi:spermidine synthase
MGADQRCGVRSLERPARKVAHVGVLFEELANVTTGMGELSLRRRREPSRQVDVFEVKLGDEYLMSSLFTVAEIELARLGLAAVGRQPLSVVVGGLGLGYSARAVLEDSRVSELLVVEALAPVIDWHEAALLPASAALTGDARCRFVHGDFFAMARGADGFDDRASSRRFDAVLVDIDHTPSHVLDPSHADLYTEAGLRRLVRYLAADGVFALWSDDPPDEGFVSVLAAVFAEVRADVVTFPNFLTGGTSSNTVYLGVDVQELTPS